MTKNIPYWLETALVLGKKESVKDGSILIIGSGLSGASIVYFLAEKGVKDISLCDYKVENSASFRNCGHILLGTVESMEALTHLHGQEKAQIIWSFSKKSCNELEKTLKDLDVKVDYHKKGALSIALDEVEDRQLQESIKLLNKAGFASEYFAAKKVKSLGFKNVFGARYDKECAHAHPVKVRNALLEKALSQGLNYYHEQKVLGLEQDLNGVCVSFANYKAYFDLVVIASNAYGNFFSDFFSENRLLEPFRGQIIVSKPMKHSFKVCYPHSFEHGYEYALITEDNRLMIGGWRNKTEKKEIGTYDIKVNHEVEDGLKDFVNKHYAINEKMDWEYSWSGIMASSKTGLPFIGPTRQERIYTCAAYTGHGFSWAHGSAKLLVKMILGEDLPAEAYLFKPNI